LNLVIDIGNTRVKAALFEDGNLIEFRIFDTPQSILADSPFINRAKQAIIGSVVDGLDDFYSALNGMIPCTVFNSQTITPLVNQYQSASTLGSDRLSASVGAYFLYPKQNVLVIDAGTCIKYNFTDSDNNYLGGAISPGINMRFKALNHFTSKLPLIQTDPSYHELIGSNTQNSILSGVLNGCVAEIDGTIDAYKLAYPTILVLLTGGDSEYFAKRLKNSIFAHQNLVLKGLNDILNYNLERK
jgi:type III pantothenate kinase